MTIEELLAKQAIADVLYRYCRSLDRMDRALYDTVFTADADLDYGEHFTGSAAEFREWVWSTHESMQAHSHQIANVLTEVDAVGGRAVSESYVTVCLRTRPDAEGATLDIVDRGRYLDRWKQQDDGSWRIASRRFIGDISQMIDTTNSPPVGSVRDTADPSYTLFGS